MATTLELANSTTIVLNCIERIIVQAERHRVQAPTVVSALVLNLTTQQLLLTKVNELIDQKAKDLGGNNIEVAKSFTANIELKINTVMEDLEDALTIVEGLQSRSMGDALC